MSIFRCTVQPFLSEHRRDQMKSFSLAEIIQGIKCVNCRFQSAILFGVFILLVF